MKKKLLLIAVLMVALGLLAGCGSKETAKHDTMSNVKLGYFPNITHAPAMVGIDKGFFQKELGDKTMLETKQFPNGSAFMDALTTGQIDIGYTGPEPVLSRYLQGGDVVVLSGASNGGNLVIARQDSGISSIADLAGKTVATPARACTHDISLRILMQESGLKMQDKGGNVKQVTQTPADMVTLFQQKQLDAAVVSEPWASQMEQKVGAKVIVDWDKMPWGGKLPGTILVASKKFVQEHPEVVKEILKGNVDAINYIKANQAEAMDITQKHIAKLTKQELPKEVVQKSFSRVEMTYNIEPQTLQEMEKHSQEFGLVKGNIDLNGLVDLSILKQVAAN